MGAASLMCSTVFPFIIAPSLNSNAQPSLSTLKRIGSIPKFCAATCVLNLVLKLGLKKSNPMRLCAPKFLSNKGCCL